MAGKTENFVRLQVPYYQFPLIWGSTFDNSGTKKKLTLWTTLKDYASSCKKYNSARGHALNSVRVYMQLLGKDDITSPSIKKQIKDKKLNIPYDDFWDDQQTLKGMKSANFTVYRVNAYDIKNCRYFVKPLGHADSHEETFNLNYPLTKRFEK